MSESTVFNLIEEPWLPARRQSGAIEQIPPWFITDRLFKDPFVAFAWPRPDFDRAAQEFMIGLLSSAAGPIDETEWEDQWQEPPTPEDLRIRFKKVSSAFNLDGQGERFMQDLETLEQGKQPKVAALLIDSPGEQTLKNNVDLFVKRNTISVLGRPAAAMALFTLNSYAPAGGAGHRTSLRGGGPLTTLITASGENSSNSLWGSLWPNVETKVQWERRVVNITVDDDIHKIFPWMAPTRTSNPKASGRPTTPFDTHPLQVYWGMPRRIRLCFEEAAGRRCSLTNREDTFVVPDYRTKNYGIQYSEGYIHPLSPYYRQKPEGPQLPVHPTPGGISYRLWPGMVVASTDRLREPAQVIRNWHQRSATLKETRFAAFGYDMDNMKARAWLESEWPLWHFDSDTNAGLEYFVQLIVAGASKVATLTTRAVKSALFENLKSATGDFQFIAERFYRDTENRFFDALEQASDSIRAHPESDDPTKEGRKEWIGSISEPAISLFDEFAPLDEMMPSGTLRRVRARFYLGLALKGYGKDGKQLYEADLAIPLPKQVGSE